MTMEQTDKDKYRVMQKLDANKRGIKTKKKSLIQEEIDIHEAYQLLLSERHKRVKLRTKQKLARIAALSKHSNSESAPTRSNNNVNGNIIGDGNGKKLARLVVIKTIKPEERPGR